MVYDFHVHTKFSCDSEAEMENYISAAKNKGVSAICFTDHVDFNENDYGYKSYNPDAYFDEFERIKSIIDGDIEIFSGIEFSEPHSYPDELQKLRAYPYDFIIGSVHWVNDMFPNDVTRAEYSAEDFYKLYWQEVLKTVQSGGFDCLGHIDFPKRYYNDILYDEDIINEIFSIMIHNNMLLEINTSSLRKGINSSMPDKELLNLYKKCGGRFVTIGSDAHIEYDLAADYAYADSLIKNEGLKKAVFKKHKLILLEE